MGRVDDEQLASGATALVFIACNVREARRAEAILTDSGVDYGLSFEQFVRPGLFYALGVRPESVGVGFTVRADAAALAREVLRQHGLRTGIVDEEEPS